ncbi:hypothetical protein O6H91_10G020700 [Diphasiastrum complanatum]|uniref:Uncharacterized protein n=1 Tax=Diphasiastrum complanatum TaxID=34168 RepID=A0ACC2CF70_DIPCM|nr:hypothetical protein O6H91_10G020700 [Diphasiastrum complanatum]
MGINIKRLTLLRCIRLFWVILIPICATLPSRTGARLLRATSEDDNAGQKTSGTTIQKTIQRGTIPPNEDITDGPKTDKSTAKNTKVGAHCSICQPVTASKFK